VSGSDSWAVPAWPTPQANGYLYAPAKAELHAPLRIEVAAKGPAQLRIKVGQVSQHSQLEVKADGKKVFDKVFHPGPGEGEWQEAVYQEEWKIWANIYSRDYLVEIPQGVKVVELKNIDGDWMTIVELGYLPKDAGTEEESMIPLTASWGVKPSLLRVSPHGDRVQLSSDKQMDKAWLFEHGVSPWKEYEAKGGGVIVGEWGAFNRAPRDVTLLWMEDCLQNWKEADWGWAMWNFRGSFGVLDSGREDVDYETWRGHKVDRKMLDLLLKY
jgi:hypothetical protein